MFWEMKKNMVFWLILQGKVNEVLDEENFVVEI